MKDLDFDELDRAVNSLMKGAPKAPPDPGLTDEQTLTITPTVNDNAKPSLDTLNTAVETLNGAVDQPMPTPVQPSQPAAATPSVATRRGRFMDVVRPGSTPPVVPTRTPSRQGISLDPTRPVVSDILPSATATSPISASPSKQSEAVSNPVVATESTQSDVPASQDQTWPDPMDMVDYEPSEKEPTKPQEAPLVSPFLPDAKVEKRPLGGANPVSDDVKDSDITLADEQPKDDAGEAQLPATPAKDIDKPLPAELSSDIVALDTDTSTTSSIEDTVPASPVKMPLPEVQSTSSESQSNLSTSSPAIPVGPISIPQQYKEEPSSGDKENGSIYDTDTYHKPLTHPAKKKSGWMWVVWIVLILVLGAGIGAGLYLLGVF